MVLPLERPKKKTYLPLTLLLLSFNTTSCWEKIMGLSIGHILLVLVIVLVLFGAGRLPSVMGDLGKGIRSFKDGLSSKEDAKDKPDDKEPKA
jgi:sec-independent protein translocase protein TatA